MDIIKDNENNSGQNDVAEVNKSDYAEDAVDSTEDDRPLNKLYQNISIAFHIAEYIFFAATLLFIVVFVASNPETISYRNLLAIVNEVNATQPEYDRYSKLNYSTETPEKSVVFGSGIAVLSDDNIFMFSGTGRFIYSQLHGIENPYVSAKGKYAVVYSFGSNEYKIYSSYNQIHSGSTEYPIYSCSVSADGSVTFVEYLPSGKTRVCCYNSSFEETGYIDISGYAVFTETASDGIVHVVSLSSAGGESVTVLKSYDMKNGINVSEHKFASVRPVELNVLDNGYTVLILNDRSVILNESFNIADQIFHEKPYSFAFYGNVTAIATADEMLLFDHNGEMIRRENLDDVPRSMCMTEKFVFLLMDDRVDRYSIYYEEDNSSQPVSYDSCKIAALTDYHIVSFGKSGAAMIDY